jgi:ABC-2 type transport system ATP-binding protein
MEVAVSTRQLRKEYDDVVALRALDFEAPAGAILGLIGPNGAGKSTLLKILAAALQPDFGSATVAGFDVERQPLEVRRSAGFMPDFFALYETVTAEDFLAYFALAFGLPRERALPRAHELLEMVNLQDKRTARISELSRGMRQRLVLAKTLAHDPAVLLLDEPLSGLDPMARMNMREALRNLNAQGRTVIISSHILAEMTDFCTHACILEKGALLASGSIAEIQQRTAGSVQAVVEVGGDPAAARAALAALPGAEVLAGDGPLVRFALSGDRARLAEANAALVAAGVPVLGLREQGAGLEDIYFKLSSHEVQ